MIHQNSSLITKLRIFTLIWLAGAIIVSSSPPGTSKQKRDGRNPVDDGDHSPNKKSRKSRVIEGIPRDGFITGTQNSSEKFKTNEDKYSEVADEVTEFFKKFDFISNIFYTKDEKVYRNRQKEFIDQIRTKMVKLIEESEVASKAALSFFLGRTCSNTLSEYRNEMVHALSFIKIKMFEQAADFCTAMSRLLDEIKIYEIIIKQYDNESICGTDGSRSPKNYEDLVSTERAYPRENEIEVEEESVTAKIDKYLNRAGPSSYNLLTSENSGSETIEGRDEMSDEWERESGRSSPDSNMDIISQESSSRSILVIRKREIEDKESSKEEESWEVINKIKPLEQRKYSIRDISFNSMYNEKHINKYIISTQNYYLGKDKYNKDVGFHDIKTFISHINEGYMPQFEGFKSKLAQALTSCIIIMQETGMVDSLISEYKISNGRTKFVTDMLFEQEKNRKKYKEDEHISDYLGLNTFYESKQFNKLNKKLHAKIDKGEGRARLAAIQLAINTFPKLSMEFGQNQDQGTIDEQTYYDFTDLEEVLMKKELVVLVHPKEYEVFINYSTRNMINFYNRFLSLAVRILERHYLGTKKQGIRIVYRRTKDPIGDLMAKKGNMTGIYFIMEELYPSSTLFGSSIETLKVPVMTYSSHIVIHKRYAVDTLETWHKFIKNPQDEKRVIVTNFRSKALFAQAGSYKIMTINLANQKDSAYLIMTGLKPIAGVFWGLDPNYYLYKDYNLIEFPYCSIQGPYFRAD